MRLERVKPSIDVGLAPPYGTGAKLYLLWEQAFCDKVVDCRAREPNKLLNFVEAQYFIEHLGFPLSLFGQEEEQMDLVTYKRYVTTVLLLFSQRTVFAVLQVDETRKRFSFFANKPVSLGSVYHSVSTLRYPWTLPSGVDNIAAD